jgi:hypothetical protein
MHDETMMISGSPLSLPGLYEKVDSDARMYEPVAPGRCSKSALRIPPRYIPQDKKRMDFLKIRLDDGGMA